MADDRTPTMVMASAGIAWIDVEGVAIRVIDLLEQSGPLAIDFARNVMKMVSAVTGRDMLGVFVALNAVTTDVQQIIAAIKAEFGV